MYGSALGVSGHPGVIAIDPASQAEGIGLKITTRSKARVTHIHQRVTPNATCQPIQFGPDKRYRIHNSARYAINPNNSANDPLTATRNHPVSGDIPLRVQVYCTAVNDADLTPGTYKAAIRIHIVYR